VFLTFEEQIAAAARSSKIILSLALPIKAAGRTADPAGNPAENPASRRSRVAT
jgi:hypothetical protein